MPTTAAPYSPDGKPMLDKSGRPLEYTKKAERRAIITCQKAWWQPKKHFQPEAALPPEGAEIRIDGGDGFRYERVPVFDSAGEIVGTKFEWIDLRARKRAEADAKALEEMKAKHAKKAQATKTKEG